MRLAILALVCLLPVMATAAPPTTASKPAGVDANGVLTPAEMNGHPIIIPSGTRIGGGTLAQRGLDKTVFIAIRTDSQTGTGEKHDPYNAGSDLHAIWATVEAQSPNEVQFAPGTYTTSQTLHAISNCAFHGNGATIKAPNTFWHTDGKDGNGAAVYKTIFGSDDLSVPDANTGYHDVMVEGFILDCNVSGQTTAGAAINAVSIISSGNTKILHNKVINFGSRSVGSGIEPFVLSVGAPWNGNASYPTGCEIAWNEFTQAGANSLYTTLVSEGGFVSDTTTAANLKNYNHTGSIHDNTFHDIFNKTATFTVNGSTVTSAAHGLQVGEQVKVTTTGVLPTGLTADTTYYVKTVTANTFTLSITAGGSAITTSGEQSGTHSWTMTGSFHGITTAYTVGGTVAENKFNHCGPDFVAIYQDTGNTIDETIRDNVMDDIYNAIWLRPALFPSGVTNNQQNIVVENNRISIVGGVSITLQDGNSSTGQVFTNPIVRSNTIKRHSGSAIAHGMFIYNVSGGIIGPNVQTSEMTEWAPTYNTGVTYVDNANPDGTSLSLFPQKFITTSAVTVTVAPETTFVRSSGASAVITLPVIGTASGQVIQGTGIVIRNEGASTATVKNSAAATQGTVLSGSVVLFRAINSQSNGWNPNYQITTGQQSGDVAAGLVAQKLMATGATYDATKLTGLTSVAHGGTDTATPGLVSGTGITVTGTWPNQTITNTGGGGGGGGGDALVANSLAQFASTTSSQLAVVMSDEVGTGGNLVFNKGPVINDAAGTPKKSADFNARELYDAAGTRAATWDASAFQVFGTTAGSSATATLGVEAAEQDTSTDNYIGLTDFNGDPAFNVNGEGTINLYNNNASGFYLEISSVNGIRQAAGLYHNFGLTSGSSGYGLRDNSGDIQFKNSGGGWSKINGVSSSAPSYGSTITPTYSGNYKTIANYTLTGNVTTINSPGGSPADGDVLELTFTEDGTGGRTLAGWNAIYALGDNTPSIPTTASKTFTIIFEYSTAKTKWLLRAVSDTY